MTRRLASFLSVLLAAFLVGEGAMRVRAALRGTAPEHPDRSLQREWNWALPHLAARKAILPGPAKYDPDLGWVLKPNLTHEGSKTNSLGMRSTREVSVERLPGTPRILFVGDSYTFGCGVDEEEALTSVLEREFLTGWEVLNLGVPGYGPDQALLMFEKFGAHHHPDVVVFGFYVRGFFRLFSDFRSYAKPYFVLRDGYELELRGVPVIRPDELYAKYASGERRLPGWKYSHLLGTWGNLISQALEDRHISADDESWKLMAAILRRFRDKAIQGGSQPFLLVIPNRPEAYEDTVFEQIDQLAQHEAHKLGMPFLSLTEGFSAEWQVPPPEYRSKEIGGHFSVHGNRLAARLLYRSLSEAALLATDLRRAEGAGG